MIHPRDTGAGTLRPAEDRPGEAADRPHDARVLTGGGQTATIVLDGQRYILRITRAGKLILTK